MAERPRMFGAFERMVARRYLRTRRQQAFISLIAWFSLIGIALGVGALIVVLAVMNGLREDLLGKVIGVNGHVVVQATEGPLADWRPLAERLAGVPGVVAATPTAEGHVMVSSPAGGAAGAVLRGLRPEQLKAKRVAGGLFSEPVVGEGELVLGARLADKLGANIGDMVTLLVPDIDPEGRTLAPRSRGFRVSGLFASGVHEFDANFIFAPLATVQQYLQLGEGVSYIELSVADVEEVAAVRRAVEAAAGPGLRVMDWQQRNRALFNALQVERWVTFLLLTLIVLVAAFNIITSLSMLVKEKGRDVAILRTIGATRGMILRIFFLDGATVGVAGTAAGLALGLTLALNVENIRELLQGFQNGTMFANEIRFLANLPARVVWSEVALVTAMALGLSFAATIYPAWRAARLDPVEALRYE